MGTLSEQSFSAGGAGALSVRVAQGEHANAGDDGVLGTVWHAETSSSDVPDIQVVMPPLLARHETVLEQWCVDGEVHEGIHERARYRYTDRLLFVAISIPERDRDIAGAAQQAYTNLFEVMAAQGFAHLVRCWNYFADINVEQDSPLGTLERYRLFNIGRQAAFEGSDHSAEVGSPAACALGTRKGPLTLYALAARSKPRCIENPRQVSAYRYPERYGPKTPSFSRGSVLSDPAGSHVLFVSGTASIVGHESIHLGDVVAQTEESLRNIVTVVAQANLELGSEVFSSHKLCYKVFVRHPGDASLVADTIRRVLGGDTEMVILRADVCRAELLVEIEAVGFA